MRPFDPDFEIIKMDAEVTSYQSDDEPERDREHDGIAREVIETPSGAADG